MQLPDGIKKEDAIAYLRYTIIQPLLDAPKGEIRKIAKEISEKTFSDPFKKKNFTLSERQVFRLFKKYREQGYSGLKPTKNKNLGTHPKISSENLNLILSLKKEGPYRSAQKIITMLEITKTVDAGVLKTRTVNRILNQYGYTREALSKDSRVFVKHEKEEINQMWISDVMDGFYIDFDGNSKKMCYLVGFEDDCSRVVTHAQFYFDGTLPKLEDTLKKAILKHALPEKIYVDNGKIYISNHFRFVCAKLGIKLVHSTPYSPTGKGKKERVWKTIQDSFMNEVRARGVKNISELNELFFAWLKFEYHDKNHSALDMTPLQRWELSLKQGQKLKYVNPLDIDDIFLYESERTITKYGVISFEGNTYEAPGSLVSKKVTVKFDPFDLSCLKIYYKDKFVDVARIIDLKKSRHKDVEKVISEPASETEISKMYFEYLQINFKQHLEAELLKAPDNSIIADSDKDIKKSDDALIIVPNYSPTATSSSDFFNIISEITQIKQFSYHEKSILAELWSSLKDFNTEILKNMLQEFKNKAPDFSSNFIFYLQQIKNLYIENIGCRPLSKRHSSSRRKSK
jgi:putative transposase